jgi:hypothetical protein
MKRPSHFMSPLPNSMGTPLSRKTVSHDNEPTMTRLSHLWLSTSREKTIKMSIRKEDDLARTCYFPPHSFLFLPLFSRSRSLWGVKYQHRHRHRHQHQRTVTFNLALVLHPLPCILVVHLQVMITTALTIDDWFYFICWQLACGISAGSGFTAAINQLAYGAPPGMGAGDACGRCFRLTGTGDPYTPSYAGPFHSIVVKATNLW